ncbi:hypothetical protein OIU78_006444 [Salix suchowensis]|nr:hypothetical protein OIU78_006444 [Salix suchowensis]
MQFLTTLSQPVNCNSRFSVMAGAREITGATKILFDLISCFVRNQSPEILFLRAVTSSVDEQSSLIEKPSWISIQKLGALRWLQKETYETENLGTGSFLEKKMKGGVDCGLTEATRLGRSRRSLHLLKPVVWRKFDMFQSWREGEKHWRRLIRGWGLLLMCKIYSIILETLMQIVKSTLQANPNNSVNDFKDNSGAIKGFPVKQLRPAQPGSTYVP